MHITRVTLKNYRNYEALSVEPCPGLNVFTGENAQGKTNLLEAIYFTSIGRSMRTPRDRELIRWGEERATIRAEAEGPTGRNRVDVALNKAGLKKVEINGAQAGRLGELMGVITAVLFSPDEIAIVKAGPGERRRFTDIALCQLSRTYFYVLQRYNRILAQRNRLLKSGADGDTLDVWDLELVRYGAKVTKTRRGFVARMSALAAAEHSRLTSGSESLSLSYEGLAGESEEEIARAFTDELHRTRERDRAQGFTHAGPQTDDMAVLSGDIDLRKYGSQGQQRTAALSLKLGSLELLRGETGECPILLLDDVFSELDEGRVRRLIGRVSEYQTIITATHIEENLIDLFSSAKLFTVSAGKVSGGGA